MRDFPPEHTAYLDQVGDAAQAGSKQARSRHEPDTRSPTAFLWWLMRDQGSLLMLAAVLATVWNLPMVATPWLLGQTIDHGIIPGDVAATAWWLLAVGVTTVLGSSTGVWYHTAVVRSWVVALYGTVTLITHKSTTTSRKRRCERSTLPGCRRCRRAWARC